MEATWFPSARVTGLTSTIENVDGRGIILAHWFLILLFLIPWTALLTWRHHRMKKRNAAGTAEP